MDILKKIIISNNKRPILLHTDSRNDNSLSKVSQASKTNYANNIINYKSSYVNIQNSKMKLKKNIPKSKLNIFFCKKGVNNNSTINETNKECKLISYIDLGSNKIKKYSKIKNKKDTSQDYKLSNTYKKDLIINNNITNNISNNITNIILTNNNKKPNRVDNDNSLLNKNIEINNNLSQRLQRKKRIIKNNKLDRCNYNKLKFYYKCDLSSRNTKNSEKLNTIKANAIKIISKNLKNKENEKENKAKIITERNKNNINTYFTNYINSSSHLTTNNTNSSNIPTNYKSKKNLTKYKNITNNIELDINSKKLKTKQKSFQKLKEYNTYKSNLKKKFINFNSSMKYLEDSVSLNSNNQNLTKIKAENDKNQNIKNNLPHNSKSNRNNKNIFTKIQKQYKPNLNINVNDIKNLNQMKSLFDNRIANTNSITNKSFGDKNNISYINSSVTLRGNIKENNFKKNNQTLIYSNSKSKQDLKYKSKESNIFKYKKKYNNDIIMNIYKNYKTDRSIGYNSNTTFTNDENSNINIINIINNFNQKNISNNKSFLSNHTDLLKNKTLKSQKRKISLNVHKNIKRYFLSKSLQKHFDISSTFISYKNDNYNSYKEQYLYNKANSYRNISYISRERDSKNYTKRKKTKYCSNQKKIHNKKIIINKNKNRCKKQNNIEYAKFNIQKNDLVNLINIKNNKINIIKKKLLKKNPRSTQNYAKDVFNNITKQKIETRNNEISMSRETHNPLSINALKNILGMNSDHFSPKLNTNNNLMKNYNISVKNVQSGGGGLIHNKSFKLSNPYHNITSLNKKKKIKIEDIIYNKDKDKKMNTCKNNKKNKLIKDNKENIKKKENKENLEEKNINKENDNIFKSKSKPKDTIPITKYFLKTENNQNNTEVNKCELSFNKGINEEKKDLKQYEINQDLKNKNNPQYLTEYIYDILENLLLDESSYISINYIDSNYLLSLNNTELSEEIREVSINWLIMIIYKIFKFKENTLFLTVQIIDRFLSKKILSVERTELLILCSLILSSKHEEIDYVNMVESLQLSSNKFSKEDIINMQYEILNELNFELIIPTMNDYYNIYCTILNFDEINTNKGLFLLNIVLVDYHIIKYPNFLISLGVVKLIYKKNIVWLIKRIRFFFIKNKQDKFLAIISDEKNLDNVCDEIKKIYKKYLDNKYKNIEEKFSDEKYNSVANMSEDLIDVSDI